MSLSHAANAGRHSLSARGDDLYETPPMAVQALLKVESLPESIWEPACGPGSIVGVLRAAGHRVYATDLRSWGCPVSGSGIDFLMEPPPRFLVGAIVTNPPYKLADQFVAHALKLCPRVIMPPGLPGKPTPIGAARWRLIGAGSCFQKPAADDASARLARAQGIERDSFRLVCLGSRLSRQGRVGSDMTTAAVRRCKYRIICWWQLTSDRI